MRALFAFLADYALAHPDGKMYIIGGGVELLRPPSFPYVHPSISLATRLEFTPAESGRQRTIEVHAIDSDGNPFAPPATIQATPQRNPEHPTLPVSVQFVLNMQGLAFQDPGSRSFSILVDGQEIASVPLHVVQGQQV